MSRSSFMSRMMGPMGAVVLHILLFFLLVHMIVFTTTESERKIDICVVDASLEPAESEHESQESEASEESEAVESLSPPEMTEMLPLESAEMPSLDIPEFSMESLEDVVDVETPLEVTGAMEGRSEPGRKKLIREFGGLYGNQAEKAVIKGLDWLKSVQCKDGSWGVSRSKSMTAKQERARLTGLALLSYLAHGETPQSEDYGETVQRAIQYLLAEQDPKTGWFCPFSKRVGSHDDIGVYGHAIATYALTEAYGLTRAPVLKNPVEQGVAVIVKGQQAAGGWDHRYQKSKWSDLSVSGWQVQALKAAQVARVRVDGVEDAIKQSTGFVQKMHAGEGKFYYRLGNKAPNGGLSYMSGAAVLCMQLAGEESLPEVRNGLEFLKSVECSSWENGWAQTKKSKSFNIAYEWYYTTQALFQKGGSKWTHWNKQFAPMLIESQDGSGAWKPPTEEGKKISKDIIYTTTFCTLSLQVYYRILPTFKKVKVAGPAAGFDEDVRINIF